MPDKTANWGVPGSGARYRTQDSDPTGGGNFRVAQRLDSNGDPVDVLLEWNETAGEWKYGGPVNLDGEDVTNVGALDANSVSTESGKITDHNNKTINVPTDAATVKDALILAAEMRRPADSRVIINIESGHAVSEPFEFSGTDIGYVTLTSEDATVPVDTGIDTSPGVVATFTEGTRAPRWDIILDGQGVNIWGLRVGRNSTAVVSPGGRGCQNFGGNNVNLTRNAKVVAPELVARDGDDRGISVTHNCQLFAEDIDASGNADFAIRVSNSFVDVNFGDASNSKEALHVTSGSHIRANNLDGTNASDRGMDIRGAVIEADAADFSGATNSGLVGTFARVNIRDGDVSSGGTNVFLNEGCSVNMTGCQTTNGTPAIGDTNLSNFNALESSGVIYNDP